MYVAIHPAICPVWQSLWFSSPHHVFHPFYCLKYKVYHHTQQFNATQQCATCSVHQNHHQAPRIQKFKNTSINVIEVPLDGSDQLKHVHYYGIHVFFDSILCWYFSHSKHNRINMNLKNIVLRTEDLKNVYWLDVFYIICLGCGILRFFCRSLWVCLFL